jgi:iron uptake system EfeUOB component EfeO/EfeM
MKIPNGFWVLFWVSIISAFLLVSCSSEGISEKKKAQNILIISQIAEKINSDFQKIKTNAQSLADYTVKLYVNQNQFNCTDKNNYAISSTGVLYKPVDDFNSAVYVSGRTPITEEVWKIVCFTEPLDSIFKEIIKNNEAVAQTYYNDRHNYNRIYPFFDVLSQYEPRLDITSFNFYYLADEKHNPEKKALWVNDSYVDPAGRGWMISAIAPVYNNNTLEGVSGIDVTINTITDKYLTANQNDILIVDNSGLIVTASETTINLLGLPTLSDHKYIETIKKDTYKKEDYNLLQNRDSQVRNAFNRIVNEFSEFETINLSGDKYFLFAAEIKELNWRIIKLLKK